MAFKGRPVYVDWRNELPQNAHVLGVPDALILGMDSTLNGAPTVRVTTHLHGGNSESVFDGGPDSWFSSGIGGPRAVGPTYQTTLYKYDNDEPERLLFYHDHALGITRMNVSAPQKAFRSAAERPCGVAQVIMHLIRLSSLAINLLPAGIRWTGGCVSPHGAIRKWRGGALRILAAPAQQRVPCAAGAARQVI